MVPMDFGNGPENSSIPGFQDQVRSLTNENVQLQDRNERLYSKIGELQEKMGQLAGSKTNLSSRLIHSEEEKLKISKDFVDFQIEANKMREQHEAENFELKTLILSLENRILEVELHTEKTTGERDALRERLEALEANRKELADEYLVLKSNYLALGKEHEQEVAKNEELSKELLNLALCRVPGNLPESNAQTDEPTEELKRVRALVRRLSARKVRPEDVVASEHERQKLEKSLFGNQDYFAREIEKMKEMYNSQQQKLEERVVTMGKELQEAKKAIRSTQHKMAEQSAVLLSSQSQLQEVEAENSQLQLQLKELNEEYRSRLVQYITDLAEYIDSKSASAATGAGKAPSEPAHMKRFVDSMLKDIRASYKSREEQLAGAARGYKKRMQKLVKRHEGLLVAYRMQREQIRSLGTNDMDPGPAEHHFSITDAELLTSTSQELNQLREDKANLEGQLQELQMKVKLSEHVGPQTSPPHTLDEAGWVELRKQLREFTHSTQEDLEKERSQLLARATVAEEQVAELQDYVDKHLGRYKEEILRLRKLLGTDGLRVFSAGASNAPVTSKTKRNISKET
ncbi:coiled-coil domain-containing protein 78 [Sceloporus undulatus]|uniref:coiled-coil domain-containing protein 78 n=1 Tax=Sceloporus undulatus TaxID=8520 RepID=UPI001C4DB42A|nr:coiled-coil domain-containing protein 78 [Sceloporus undulatus]